MDIVQEIVTPNPSDSIRYPIKGFSDRLLDNQIIQPPPQGDGDIVCQERLGGLLKSYRRTA
jgi:hypothetical protein